MWALVQYQDVIQNLLLISGTLLLVYVAAIAALQLLYGKMGNEPGESRALVAAGMAAMLFLPLSDFLGIATSDETARIAGLTHAQNISHGGYLAVPVTIMIEQCRHDNHDRPPQ